MNIFDKLSQKLNIKFAKNSVKGVSSPIAGNSDSEFFNRMSKHAIGLYEKKCDIKHFTKLALSDPENTSHIERVEQLFEEGVLDPLDDKIIEDLANNKNLLDDLGM